MITTLPLQLKYIRWEEDEFLGISALFENLSCSKISDRLQPIVYNGHYIFAEIAYYRKINNQFFH